MNLIVVSGFLGKPEEVINRYIRCVELIAGVSEIEYLYDLNALHCLAHITLLTTLFTHKKSYIFVFYLWIISSQLKEAAPTHMFLQDLDLKTSLFDRAAQRFEIA